MTPAPDVPAVIITIPLEAALACEVTAKNHAEALRLADWINHHPDPRVLAIARDAVAISEGAQIP